MKCCNLLARVAALIVAVSVSTSCDPCFGTSSCGATAGSRLAIQGQLVRASTGRGVDGVRIDVVRRGGVALATDSFSVVTSGGGFWHIESAAQSSGAVDMDFRVNTPELPHPYTVAGRRFNTVDRAGVATVLERWVVDPYSNYFVNVFVRTTNQLVTSTPISFRRRSKTWLTGPSVSDSAATSVMDANGFAKLFEGFGFFTDTGDVVGDLSVPIGSGRGTVVIPGVVLHPTYQYHETPIVLRLGAGPSLAYAVVVINRANGRGAPGVAFKAVRVSGVPVVSDTVTGVSDADGYVRPGFVTSTSGTLRASLTLTPRVGAPVTVPLTMPTFDNDSDPVLTEVIVGAGLNYAVLVFDRATGRPAPGVPFTATRVSGVPVDSSTVSGVTTSDGYAWPNFVPRDTGTLVASLTFSPKVGPQVTGQFKMPTFESDPGRLIGNISVGSYMNYYGILHVGPTTPLGGVPVRVRATGGAPVTPVDTTVTSHADGIFQITSIPQAVGNVTYELTFLLPPPYKPFVVRNIVLGTMQVEFPFGQLIWEWDVTAAPNGPPGSDASYLP